MDMVWGIETIWLIGGCLLAGLLIVYVLKGIFSKKEEKEDLRKSSLDRDFFNHELQEQQHQFIMTYEFSPGIPKKIQTTYPHLSSQDISLVLKGLREFFLLCHLAGYHTVSLPSQVVDVAWHEFILSTRDYETFCRKSFGRFLHHTPAEAMQGTDQASDGIKRAWALACKRDGIDPKAPSHLPLLFGLDAQLDITDGYKYSLDCRQPGSYPYCAMHIGEPWLPASPDAYSSPEREPLYSTPHGCGGGFDSWFGGSSCSGGGGCAGGCGGD